MQENTPQSLLHAVKFHGRSGEYFRIWLVNALLTIVTLGSYSAWAVVRRRRYFYGNSEIAGDRFEYHARPINILIGRLIILVGFVAFLLVNATLPTASLFMLLAFFALAPWLVIRSWRYNALMSSFRGVRFNYHCRTGEAYWAMLVVPFVMTAALYFITVVVIVAAVSNANASIMVMIVAFSIAALLFFCGMAVVQGITSMLTHQLYVNNLCFGNQPFHAALKKKAFIKIMLAGYLGFLPGIVIFLLLSGNVLASFVYMTFQGVDNPELYEGLASGAMINLLLAYLVLLANALIVSAALRVAVRNYVYRQTTLGEAIRLKSTLKAFQFIQLMVTNALMIIFTLGFGAPVAEIRLARYLAANTFVEGDLTLASVQAHHDETRNAVAEEAVAAFDLSPGI